MSWDVIDRNWDFAQEKLKTQWDKLTDDDITVVKGRRDQLERLLETYYGYDQAKARFEVDNWLRQF